MVLSIILPAYNATMTISETIESVINQTFLNWELIIIDDGSTDGTHEIVNKYMEKDKRIVLIRQKNKGYRSVRNTGLELAKGKYISFIDSDDKMRPELLQNLLIAIEKYSAHLVVSGYYVVKKDSTIVEAYKYEEVSSNDPLNEIGSRFIGSLPDRKDSIMPAVWSNIYIRDIILKNNIRFITNNNIVGEDLIFNLNYLKCINKGLVSSITGYEYTLSAESVTRKFERNKINQSLNTIKYLSSSFQTFFSNQIKFEKRLQMNFLLSLYEHLILLDYGCKFKSLKNQHREILSNSSIRETLLTINLFDYKLSRITFIFIVRNKLYFVTSLMNKFRKRQY